MVLDILGDMQFLSQIALHKRIFEFRKAKWIESYFENVNTKWKNLKCSKKSAELRQSGNKLYQKKHNQDALESYNLVSIF